MVINFIEKEKYKEKEGKENISQLPPICILTGIKTAIQIYALTGNGSHNFSVYGTILQPTDPHQPGLYPSYFNGVLMVMEKDTLVAMTLSNHWTPWNRQHFIFQFKYAINLTNQPIFLFATLKEVLKKVFYDICEQKDTKLGPTSSISK